MGIWAGQTISQDTYLGWMSNAEGFNYFVTQVLPDILTGSAKVSNPAGSNLGPVADIHTVVIATNAAGVNLPEGPQSIPQATLEAAQNPPAPVPVATVPTPAVTDGIAALRDELNQWGLGSLADRVVQWKNQGLDDTSIVALVRGTGEWKSRFSGIVARQQKGLPAGSESDALAYEQTVTQTLAQFGITGYTRDDAQRWYGDDKSAAEMSKRAQIASQWAYNEPPEARAAVQRLYGITPGDVTHFAFDEQKALPEIQRKLDAAQVAGTAGSAGFNLNAAQAELIGQYADPAQAAQQFNQLGQQRNLFTRLPGEQEITLDDVIAGYFGGNADKLALIRQRAQARGAMNQAGGGFAQSQQGAYGVGVVQPA